jgi:hypothetical protein
MQKGLDDLRLGRGLQERIKLRLFFLVEIFALLRQ